MGRPSKNDILLKNKSLLIDEFKSYGKNILSIIDIGKVLNTILNSFMPYNLTRSEFESFILSEKIVRKEKISLPKRNMTKYIFGKVSKYELALSINKDSYLSHYTAVFLYGLTDNVPKLIYTNLEQYKKSHNSEKSLIQINIDKAFSRPMRETNNIAKLKDFNVVLLNGKNTGNLEVVKIKVDNKELPITSLERTLIDIVIRPNYSGGVLEILEAYKSAKGNFSTGRLIATLKNLNYVYPYHQAIGFYLEKAGYPESVLSRFDKLDKNHDFYLTYQMKDKNYSSRWKIYYPPYLDQS